MQVINRHKVPKDHPGLYIGRGTKWGNPFKVEGDVVRGGAAIKFRKMLARKLAAKDPATVSLVKELISEEFLICSCAPLPCHGDVFKELIEYIIQSKEDVNAGIRNWVKDNGYSFGPSTDGADHINMYSKGKTDLGRKLTNMSDIPVYIEGIGEFRSMEGYWYWLSTGQKYRELLTTDGFQSKKIGKTLERIPLDNFQDKIRVALWKRFEQNPKLKQELIESGEIKLTHYYYFGEDDDRTVTYPPFDWVTNEVSLIRDIYQGKKTACIIAGSRDITDIAMVEKAINDSGFNIDIVVCGGARGVDSLGAQWGVANGKIVRYFHPDWDRLNKKAGILRNVDMGNYAHKAIVLVKDNSKGSTHMAEYMASNGKDCYTVSVSS